jgi:hypothetical protein
MTALLIALALMMPGDIVIDSTHPLIPGVDWSREAAVGYFASPPWLRPCSIVVRRVASGYEIVGTGGRIAADQRFVGCAGDVAVFQ